MRYRCVERHRYARYAWEGGVGGGAEAAQRRCRETLPGNARALAVRRPSASRASSYRTQFRGSPATPTRLLARLGGGAGRRRQAAAGTTLPVAVPYGPTRRSTAGWSSVSVLFIVLGERRGTLSHSLECVSWPVNRTQQLP